MPKIHKFPKEDIDYPDWNKDYGVPYSKQNYHNIGSSTGSSALYTYTPAVEEEYNRGYRAGYKDGYKDGRKAE